MPGQGEQIELLGDEVEQAGDRLGGQPVDLVLSDMAPNMSGTSADQPRAMYLCELALDMAARRVVASLVASAFFR